MVERLVFAVLWRVLRVLVGVERQLPTREKGRRVRMAALVDCSCHMLLVMLLHLQARCLDCVFKTFAPLA